MTAKQSRLNVSIPSDLKKEMDKWPVNWSGLFQDMAREKIEIFKTIEKSNRRRGLPDGR